jgi:elongation factor P
MAFSASDLRKGLRIEVDGVPYLITEFNFVKPGKGQGLYTCKMKNLVNGATMTRTYRDNVVIDEPKIEEKKLRYSYENGDSLVFTDQSYEEVTLAASVLGDSRHLLTDDMEVSVVFHNGRPIDVTLPTFVEKLIEFTEPGARGNTATNVLKPARIPGGFEIQVPLFVVQGDIVRIDTRTFEYVDRVSKK